MKTKVFSSVLSNKNSNIPKHNSAHVSLYIQQSKRWKQAKRQTRSTNCHRKRREVISDLVLYYRSRRSRKQRSNNAELRKDQLPGQRAFSLEYAIDWKFNCTVIFSLVVGKRKENYLSSQPMNVGNFYVNGIGFRLFLKSTYVKVTTWEFRNTSVSYWMNRFYAMRLQGQFFDFSFSSQCNHCVANKS